MKKENIFIITRAMYPNLAPRAHRATELAKELARQGHNVTIAAVLGKYDYSEFEKQYNIKVENLGVSKYEWITSDRDNRNISLWRKGIIYFLRKWFLFPDIKISFRVAKYLKNKNNIDKLITIAIPYSIHFGATYAKTHHKNLLNTKWISDCGDPFFYSKIAFYFKKLESRWKQTTDYITIPTEKIKKFFGKEYEKKIHIIPQGFSFDSRRAKYQKNDIVTFAYSGMVYPKARDPREFLKFLKSFDKDFKFVVYTNKPQLFQPFYQDLGEKLEMRNYVEHDELIYQLSKMDFLINISHKDASPSKMIDYMLADRPILEIDSTFNQKEQFIQFYNGDYTNKKILSNFDDYKIENVAKKFIEL